MTRWRRCLQKLWDRNISLSTRLVDTVTTAMLLKVVRSGKLVTRRFAMNHIMKAYDTCGNAAKEDALNVVSLKGGVSLIRWGPRPRRGG
jgi:alcohol dehydrogenase